MEKAFKGISMPQFYKFGSILFTVGVIGAIINTKIQWVDLNVGGKISMVSSVFFQLLFLALFLTLFFQTRVSANQKIINNPNLDDFVKELQLEDSNNMKGGIKNGKENTINNRHKKRKQ